jgi:hypothetical protein
MRTVTNVARHENNGDGVCMPIVGVCCRACTSCTLFSAEAEKNKTCSMHAPCIPCMQIQSNLAIWRMQSGNPALGDCGNRAGTKLGVG